MMLGLNLAVIDPHHCLNSLMPFHDFLLFFPKHFTSGLRLHNKKPQTLLHLRYGTKRCPYVHCQTSQVEVTSRRSAHYHPSIWDHSLIESIESPYTDTKFNQRIEELKHEVEVLLKASKEPFPRVELIDSIIRLGVAYHFQKEIEKALDRVYADGFETLNSLHDTALCFRLLRQQDYTVSCDVFQKFTEEDGGFKACLGQDAKGLLSLYEAAHLAFLEETILDAAKEFSVRHLNKLKESMDMGLAEQVEHSLEMPLQMRTPRLEARYHIDVYEREEKGSSTLLELAKLDFNVTQWIHQMEMKELSRWWKDLGLGEKNTFARDRLPENYFLAVGMASEPRFSKCRKFLTKLFCMLTFIDDMYDIYGSLEELHIFTAWVKRFNLDDMENQPHYLKLTFLALHNFINEAAYTMLKDHGWDIMPFLKKQWKCHCEALIKEAEWFNKGYTPTFEEYMENGWISGGGAIILAYAYLFLDTSLTSDQTISCLEMVDGPVYCSSMIGRLYDDLATSKDEMERGDTPKSIQCHMNAFGVSEEVSREFIEGLVSRYWKKLNKECIGSSLPRSFINVVVNMARVSNTIFQYGDGYSTSTGVTRNQLALLLIDNIPIK